MATQTKKQVTDMAGAQLYPNPFMDLKAHQFVRPRFRLKSPIRKAGLSVFFKAIDGSIYNGSDACTKLDTLMDADGSANFTHYTDSNYYPHHDPLVNPWNVCAAPGPDLRNSGWHWLAATYDGDTMRVFVDGQERAVRFIGKPMTYPFHLRFLLGKATNDPEN